MKEIKIIELQQELKSKEKMIEDLQTARIADYLDYLDLMEQLEELEQKLAKIQSH